MNESILTPQEVADILKLKKNTVYEMIKRGDIKASKMGKQFRILRKDVDAYLYAQSNTKEVVSTTDTTAYIPSTPVTNNQLGSFIICGQDILLDKICNYLNENTYGVQALRSYKGSYNALYSMYQGQAQIATAHMWDPETDTYNLPYVSKVLPGLNIAVFHLACRKQGFYVPTGNPLKIKSFEDLRRPGLRFVNRELGSGTRILLDCKMQKLGISPQLLKGYTDVVNSHLEAATHVAKGDADFALGNERTSLQLPSIDFVPLQTESYEMFIRTSDMSHPLFSKIIQLIQSKEFQDEVNLMGGYDLTDMGKRLL